MRVLVPFVGVLVLIVILVPTRAGAEPQRLAVGSATLVLDFPDGGSTLDELALSLERDKKVVWQLRGWKALAGGRPVPQVLEGPCDTFGVGLVPQKLRKRASARIDVACRNGEDMFTATGVAILVDTLEPYTVLWLGDGDSLSSENDACISEHTVKFDLGAGKLIETSVDTTRTNADGSCEPGGKPGKLRKKTRKRAIAL